jgi:hypothetical protein
MCCFSTGVSRALMKLFVEIHYTCSMMMRRCSASETPGTAAGLDGQYGGCEPVGGLFWQRLQAGQAGCCGSHHPLLRQRTRRDFPQTLQVCPSPHFTFMSLLGWGSIPRDIAFPLGNLGDAGPVNLESWSSKLRLYRRTSISGTKKSTDNLPA